MSEFSLYFSLGMEHILDINGMDHILFVLALCAIYMGRDWRKILILVTAFTLGHSLTLALATLKIVNVNVDLIEFLIPVTIFITAFYNILKKHEYTSKLQLNYLFALVFGLVHGLGFSNYLQSLLGKEASILMPLLAFNLGLELGQIIVVSISLLAAGLFVGLFGVKRRDWNMVVSAMIAGMAILFMMEAKFW